MDARSVDAWTWSRPGGCRLRRSGASRGAPATGEASALQASETKIVQALQALLQDSASSVQEAAAQSLRRIGTQDAVESAGRR